MLLLSRLLTEALAKATLLSYPKPDAPMYLITDASNTAAGAVLQQYAEGRWSPLAFFSKKISLPRKVTACLTENK